MLLDRLRGSLIWLVGVVFAGAVGRLDRKVAAERIDRGRPAVVIADNSSGWGALRFGPRSS